MTVPVAVILSVSVKVAQTSSPSGKNVTWWTELPTAVMSGSSPVHGLKSWKEVVPWKLCAYYGSGGGGRPDAR